MSGIVSAIHREVQTAGGMSEIPGIANVGSHCAAERSDVSIRIVVELGSYRAGAGHELTHTTQLIPYIEIGRSARDDAFVEILRAHRRAALGVVMRQAAHPAAPEERA